MFATFIVPFLFNLVFQLRESISRETIEIIRLSKTYEDEFRLLENIAEKLKNLRKDGYNAYRRVMKFTRIFIRLSATLAFLSVGSFILGILVFFQLLGCMLAKIQWLLPVLLLLQGILFVAILSMGQFVYKPLAEHMNLVKKRIEFEKELISENNDKK